VAPQSIALTRRVKVHYAVKRFKKDASVAVARILLENGAKVNLLDAQHLSRVLDASQGHVQVIELLLGFGADVDLASSRGRTCLREAALYRRTKVAKLVLLHTTDFRGFNAGARNAIARFLSAFRQRASLMVLCYGVALRKDCSVASSLLDVVRDHCRRRRRETLASIELSAKEVVELALPY
jgi:Ankyrin repeats (3 copies)